jgi:hypothetical protein
MFKDQPLAGGSRGIQENADFLTLVNTIVYCLHEKIMVNALPSGLKGLLLSRVNDASQLNLIGKMNRLSK